jgi:hypothetical protein
VHLDALSPPLELVSAKAATKDMPLSTAMPVPPFSDRLELAQFVKPDAPVVNLFRSTPTKAHADPLWHAESTIFTAITVTQATTLLMESVILLPLPPLPLEANRLE